MPTPAQEDVKAILSDFEDRLRAVVDRAWREWLDQPDRSRFVFQLRVRAVLVFDFIARHALAEFDNDPHIRVMLKGRQTVHFLFKDSVLVRFKKGNSKGIGSNIETQAVLSFIDPQGVIPGLVPEIMKIEICYTPDALGIDLNEVAVVARDRRQRVWAYPIERERPSADVIELPPRKPDETPPAVVPRQPQPEETTETEE
jgi:hypothetical protein